MSWVSDEIVNYLEKFKWIETTPRNYNLHYWLCIEDVDGYTGLKIKLNSLDGIHSYRNRFQFVKVDSGKIYVLDDFLKDPVRSEIYELYMVDQKMYNMYI
jgi:hypothetical protein